MKIKICGMKFPENINEIGAMCPDFMGFIFYPESGRYVGKHFTRAFTSSLPKSIKKVGVFVNDSISQISKIQQQFEFDYIQLHGHESPSFCKELKEANMKIIKAFNINECFDFSILVQYKDDCEFFLFDTKGKNFGGNSEPFNWNILQKYKLNIPYLLSGGIGLNNIDDALALKDNMLVGFDLNSKLESGLALKSKDITENIIKTIRNYEYIQSR